MQNLFELVNNLVFGNNRQ